MDALEKTKDNWHALENVEYDMHSEWQGVNAERFHREFWSQFEYEIKTYWRAVEELAEALRAAQAESGE